MNMNINYLVTAGL